MLCLNKIKYYLKLLYMSNKDFNKLTFSELRKELAYCNDKVKEKIIRTIMYNKYKEHILNKKIYIENKKSIVQDFKNIAHNNNDKYISKNEIYEKNNTNLNVIKNNIYNRDTTNNNLMQRMSNDIDIFSSKDIKKEFIPPYGNDSGDNYASF